MAEAPRNLDPYEYVRLNREFHVSIAVECGNQLLVTLVHRGWDRLGTLSREKQQIALTRAQESIAEHQHLLDLLRSSAEPDLIEKAVRDHRMSTARLYNNDVRRI